MKAIFRTLLVAFLMSFAFCLFAYIPENSEENSFNEKIVKQFSEVTNLVKDGIKAIKQEVVSSSYGSDRKTTLEGEAVKESEAGGEEVTSKEILYYEPKEEIYEAREIMDDILIWLSMYRTTVGDDVITFKKLKDYINQKSKTLDKIISALKYEKDNKDSVMRYKLKIEKIDKDFNRYLKRLKGKIELIEGKPLPEPTASE